MNREWVDKKNQTIIDRIKPIEDKIFAFIAESPIIPNDKKELFREDVSELSTFMTNVIVYVDSKKHKDNDVSLGSEWDKKKNEGLELIAASVACVFDNFSDNVINEEIKKYRSLQVGWYLQEKKFIDYYNIYLDSEPMEFDGDIVITDPCYLMKELSYEESEKIREEMPDWEQCLLESSTMEEARKKYAKLCDEYDNKYKEDWEICEYGKRLDIFGITKYMMRDTIEGDWSRTIDREATLNDGSECLETLGEFCADSGLVCVADLNQVLSYNPDFREWVETHSWCATIIEGFKGTVQFVIRQFELSDKEIERMAILDPDFEVEEDNMAYEVDVIGKGTYLNGKETCNFSIY